MTSSDGGTAAAVSPAIASASTPPDQRLLGDLAGLLLCVSAFIGVLMTPDSLGAVVVRALVAGAGVLVVAQDFRSGRAWRPSSFLLVAILFWIAGLLMASRQGGHPAGLERTLLSWGGFAVAAAAAHRLSSDGLRRRLLIAALVAAAALLAVYGFEERYLERPARIDAFDHDPAYQSEAAADMHSLAGQERFFNPRISGAFYSSNLMGAVYALGALLAAGAALRLGRRRRKTIAAVTGGLCLAALTGLVLTGSKGAAVGLVCGTAVALAMRWTAGRSQTRFLPAVLVGALLLGVVVLPAVAQTMVLDHPLDFSADHQSTGGLKSAWVRVDYWQTGARMWAHRPLGIGPDQTQQVFSQFRSPWALETPVDLHHEFFEMLVECGPLAFLGMLGVFGWLLARGLILWPRDGAPDAPLPAQPRVGDPTPPRAHDLAPPRAVDPALFLPLPVMTAWTMGGAWLLAMTIGFTELNGQIQPGFIFSEPSSDWTGLRGLFLLLVTATVAAVCWWLARVAAALPPTPVAAGAGPQADSRAAEPLVSRAVLLGALVGLLVHSGFDFVLQNHALLLLAGLLAGLVTAETGPSAAPDAVATPTTPTTPAPAPTAAAVLTGREKLRQRLPGAALAAGAIFLGWLGVVQPFRLEFAHLAAERAARRFEPLQVMLPPPTADRNVQAAYRTQLHELGAELVARRQAVLALAPENKEAVLACHQAIANYMHLSRACGLPTPTIDGLDGRAQSADEALVSLAENYIASNPEDPTRWFYAGRLYLSLGQLQRKANLERACLAFEHAAALDLQRPMLHLMVGDCRLALGDRHAAALAYAKAWRAQALGSIPEVQFYCLYYDPAAEIVPPPETGMDAAMVKQPGLLLHDLDTVESADRAALLRRYWVALRAVQLNAEPLPPPADPALPTAQETQARAERLHWAFLEKKTLDDLLALRPGSVDTHLLLSLREIAAAPPGSLGDADLANKFEVLRTLAAGSQVDPLLPGTLDRIEALLRFPPRKRYATQSGIAGESGQ